MATILDPNSVSGQSDAVGVGITEQKNWNHCMNGWIPFLCQNRKSVLLETLLMVCLS